MRKLLTYCFTAYLLVFFLMAGTGISLVHYCCDECRHAGLEHIVEHKCDAVHHHDHHHDCTCLHHDACHYLHYAVSQTTIDAPQQLDKAVSSVIAELSPIALIKDLSSEISKTSIFLHKHRTIHVSLGRAVSVLFCTYLL